MHGRFIAVRLVLGAVCFGIIWTANSKSRKDVIKPVGPKICESLCKRTVGCSRYTYMIDDLSCRLTDVNMNREDVAEERYVVKSIKGGYQKNGDHRMKRCRRNDIIFRTRGRQSVCRDQGPKLKKRIEEKQAKLLMLPHCGYRHCKLPAKQLFLNDKSVASFPNVTDANFNAVAFISASRKLAVVTERGFYLISLNNDYTTKGVMERAGAEISAITVDEQKQIMFVATRTPRNRLYNMTTEGKNYQLICRLRWFSENIAVDPKRSHIYIMYPMQIVKYTYFGTDLGTVAEGRLRGFMHVDLERDILHYMTGKPATVTRMSMETGSLKAIRLGLKKARYLYVVEKDFYVGTFPFEGQLFVVSENGSKTEIQTNFDKRLVTELRVCVIT